METNKPILTLQTMRRLEIMRKIGTRGKKENNEFMGEICTLGLLGAIEEIWICEFNRTLKAIGTMKTMRMIWKIVNIKNYLTRGLLGTTGKVETLEVKETKVKLDTI